MSELERAAVQLWEAKRLAEYDDVVHGRLALLLLDNAAETSLMRSAKSSFIYAEAYGNMAYLLRDLDPDDAEGQQLKRDIDAKSLSKRRRKQVERNFDDLVDYVFGRDGLGLEPEFAECLKILHRYRNAAYHRDSVRPDVLGPAVQIYFFLCCHLVRSERHVVHEIAAIPPSVAEIFGDRMPVTTWPGGAMDSADLARELADFFLTSRGLDHVGVAVALSDHLLARLGDLDRDLVKVAESIPPGINRRAVLQLVQQAPVDREDYDKDPPADFWTRSVPVTEETLTQWRSASAGLRGVDGAYQALREFAAVEQPLERLEEPVGRFVLSIDRAEQQAFDDWRGR
ncbi:hypothetical protein [uncultured Cellulomonas sp.]|uniref:hypothetical protein n=1 Tax=uncultured Cellulomonas sp. TaxID=189682 RepID=UPI0028E23A75|nr:hypothetical protein [uncultured Cellulomonas sp.]